MIDLECNDCRRGGGSFLGHVEMTAFAKERGWIQLRPRQFVCPDCVAVRRDRARQSLFGFATAATSQTAIIQSTIP